MVLYVLSCGSSAATGVEAFVRAAQAAGWTVCAVLTPQGTKFVDAGRLERLTGYPVRSEYKRPEEPDVLPPADAIVVYPATFNTVNKWAAGISDTLALGLLAEYTGYRAPIVVVPCVGQGAGLDTHPVLPVSLDRLRRWGVCVLYEPDRYPPRNEVPPDVVLTELARRQGAGGTPPPETR
jgi:phosphopantothenoylcysteine synthetase/decarboxylase